VPGGPAGPVEPLTAEAAPGAHCKSEFNVITCPGKPPPGEMPPGSVLYWPVKVGAETGRGTMILANVTGVTESGTCQVCAIGF
jgi:hypothetical protein